MNTGGSVGCRKAAGFNWLVLGAIFENLKYKILSLSNRAGVLQQTYLHAAKVNSRSGGKGKTTLLPKKPKRLPWWYSVWPCKEYKNWELNPGFLLVNFNWLLIFLIPDKRHCCLDNGSWDHGGNWLGDDIISLATLLSVLQHILFSSLFGREVLVQENREIDLQSTLEKCKLIRLLWVWHVFLTKFWNLS